MIGKHTLYGQRPDVWSYWTNSNVQSLVRRVKLTGAAGPNFTVPKGMVFFIDQVVASMYARSTLASGAKQVQILLNDGAIDQYLILRGWHTTGAGSQNVLKWQPVGNAVMFEDQTIGEATCSPVGADLDAFLFIHGRLMSRQYALDCGLINGTEFIVSGGNALTIDADNIIYTNPSTTASPVITSVACFGSTGAVTNGNAVIHFGDGGSNHYTAFAFCQNGNDTQNEVNVAIDHCLLEGPKGADIEVRPDGFGSGNFVKPIICGRLVDQNQTFEPTGVPQGAGSLAGRQAKFFWFFKSAGDLYTTGAGQVASTNYPCFPTGLSDERMRPVITGACSSISAPLGTTCGIEQNDTAAFVGTNWLLNPLIAAGASSHNKINCRTKAPFSVGSGGNLGLSFSGNLGTTHEAHQTVWGIMRPSRSDVTNPHDYVTKVYKNV